MKKNKYEKYLDHICKQAEIQIQKLADEYREKVLIPACKRAKMTYCSGNGKFCFYPVGKYNEDNWKWIYQDIDAVRNKKSYLIPIIQELNNSVLGSNSQCFGFYMANVTEEDIK